MIDNPIMTPDTPCEEYVQLFIILYSYNTARLVTYNRQSCHRDVSLPGSMQIYTMTTAAVLTTLYSH